MTHPMIDALNTINPTPVNVEEVVESVVPGDCCKDCTQLRFCTNVDLKPTSCMYKNKLTQFKG